MKVKIEVDERGRGTCEIDGVRIENRLHGFEVKASVDDVTQVTLHLIATELDLDLDVPYSGVQFKVDRDDTSTADSVTTDAG